MMEQIKLAQFHNINTQSKEKKREILKKVDVKYCLPDVVIHKQHKRYYYSGYTSLHFAVKSSIVDLDFINYLLEQGSDLLTQGTQDGCSPIHLAFNESPFTRPVSDELSSLQKCKLINNLLTKQVELQNTSNPTSSNGISHFHIACAANHVAAVKFFAGAKENVNQHIINSDTSVLSGYTPLHCAIKYLSIKAVEILLQHDADVDLKNAKGMSGMHLLIDRLLDVADFIFMGKRLYCEPYEEEIERIEFIIKLMLKARSSDGIFVDDTGLSTLHVACILRDESIVIDFLKQNVNVNLPVKSESQFWPVWTPLHFAACCNFETMILLMQCGADITITNSKGESALDLCAKRFAPSDIQKVLSAKNEFKDIVLSDSSTKLMDLLLVMDTYEKFSNFLQELEDVNITIPSNSPIWPGYNLLHLSASLNEKTKCRKLSERSSNLAATKNANSERYNCTEDEQALFSKRIELLLEYGCSTGTKNANGQTPIHLGFNTTSGATLKILLSCDKENAVDHKGLSHLHIACALGQLDTIKRYIVGGADVNGRTRLDVSWHSERRGRVNIRADSTPLHVAVMFNHEIIMQYLLANDADAQAADSLGFTPIHLATSMHNKNLARSLLDAATPNLQDYACTAGLSHLHAAAWLDDHEAVKRLLHDDADIDRLVDADVERYPLLKWYAGKTPLDLALGYDYSQTIEDLLRAGASVYVGSLLRDATLYRARYPSSQRLFRMLRESGKSDDVEPAGMTLLHVACASCDLEWAERLLEQGADVNARIRDGDLLDGATPLYLAVAEIDPHEDDPAYSSQRRHDLVELLVNCGADVTSKSYGSTPLCIIYQSVRTDKYPNQSEDDVEVVFLLRAADLLLSSQKSYRANPVDETNFSHFHFACVRNNVEAATKFLDHGADVNLSIDPFDKLSGGFTPLHFAMAYKCTRVAYLLLERGADVNAEDVRGNTPLHVAFKKRFRNLPLIEAMIRLGADVRAKNLNDDTLLHCLVDYRSDALPSNEYLKIIVSTGLESCLYQQDVAGYMPLHVAMKYNNPEAIEALFCIGFDINSVDLEKDLLIRTIDQPIRERGTNVTTELACHIWKIRFIRLDLTNSNLRFLESLEKQFSLVALLEQPCQDELTKAKKTEICEGVTVNDFLSELGAAAAYPRMTHIRRTVIDKYFKCIVDLYREFPEFCGLLVLQYRKALDRQGLMQPAKEAIASILQVELPELCLETLLRYFTHGEMKVVIEVADKLFI